MCGRFTSTTRGATSSGRVYACVKRPHVDAIADSFISSARASDDRRLSIVKGVSKDVRIMSTSGAYKLGPKNGHNDKSVDFTA